MTQVLERVDEYAEGQSRLLQDGFSLGDLGEGAAENVRRAVEAVPQFRVQPGLRYRHCFGGQDVPIVKQVHRLHSLQKRQTASGSFRHGYCYQNLVYMFQRSQQYCQLTVEENAD